MAKDLQLGLNTGYWAGGPPPNITELVAEAERLGYDTMWTSEAYGSDVISPLAWWGSRTEKLRLGTAIMQMSARQPAAAAMAAMPGGTSAPVAKSCRHMFQVGICFRPTTAVGNE